MEIPITSHELIDSLDFHFPEVIYDTRECRDEFLIRTGERRLVLKLKALRDAENHR